MRRLRRVALAVLAKFGTGDEVPADWYYDLCRCRHQRGQHYANCMKCDCQHFWLRVKMR